MQDALLDHRPHLEVLEGGKPLEFHATTHAGEYRNVTGRANEDSYAVLPRTMILADGAGGIAGGGQASRSAVGEAQRYLSQTMNNSMRQEDALRVLREAMHLANQAAYGGATTLDLVHVWEGVVDGQRKKMLLGMTVGDSPVYIVRKDQNGKVLRLDKVSQDDSKFTPEQQRIFDNARRFEDLGTGAMAELYHRRNEITQALGMGPIDPHTIVQELGAFDQVLAVSDFYSDNFAIDEIREMLARYPDDPEKALNELHVIGNQRARNAHFRGKIDDATGIVLETRERKLGMKPHRAQEGAQRGARRPELRLIERLEAQRPSREVLEIIAQTESIDVDTINRLANDSSIRRWGIINSPEMLEQSLTQWEGASLQWFENQPLNIQRDLMEIFYLLGVTERNQELNKEVINWRKFRAEYIVVNGEFNAKVFVDAVNREPNIKNKHEALRNLAGVFGDGADLMFQRPEMVRPQSELRQAA
ncbi:hypothetical protein A3H80_01655 [Candidatus Roizmanbacteria bacterium RIFCSPLOWO2_02_FULL_37_19]|uniref:PPM-type phosphatase domain-containing protein n=1 Tax=Candidatus Roizmanbacteria bacterium RIFCSPHIGHO2_02_FULL_37_24 TaxID=1802037 RepID=A0A1F7H118_9BACT|nr:MAG: hypothetical protein A2862_04550 [Candidatus Roizmanbacteria bacterium RIFCSPHIGHO2_01_FULL_38_41]OGK24624.1 MAG: hypothetical protein A3C24_02435 [Candidatus Roizmanbacteria bacterium RIFCSPHIGHO2_02_FULL_37_24]OGK32262.1 MAG: hypothetical protein A3E10_02375 [Candidatus Roizmanbacteria bacterium RIFCSPHIGHO2_12_FULL_37_23]OGK45556.1 MAG: hypothetical protein A2956_03145 [Candidatus Roizmanbacteria bacterium RIFCSPLOWO2_01_FULL_37_57]OGK53895.1 MAG: hypothetical protein A3H80_01655 [Ca